MSSTDVCGTCGLMRQNHSDRLHGFKDTMTEQQPTEETPAERLLYIAASMAACESIGASREWLEAGGLQRLVAEAKLLVDYVVASGRAEYNIVQGVAEALDGLP